jgi:hypothetical protein
MIEECYTLGYVDLNVFNFTLSELQGEKKQIENHLAMTVHEFRDSSFFLGEAVQKCISLSSLWNSLTCFGKRKLAEIIFPDGLLYHRDTDSLEVLSENWELIQPTTQESNHKSDKSI